MLKFVKDNMASIDGIEIYPIISMILFFAVFSGMLYWVMKKDKSEIEEQKRIPLNDD